MVRCVEITKYFAGVRALDAVNVDFFPGQVVALVGENGAGKSTLAGVLSGLLQPDGGELWFGDDRVSGLTPRKARGWGVETVYQNLALCDNLGATANVMLGQEPLRFSFGPIHVIDRKSARREAERRIAELEISLSDYDEPTRRHSGGQRQAIAIARATVRGHRMVILDEPTAALGIHQTEATARLIRRVADQDVAVVVISHNLDEVFAVSDRVVALRLGGVIMDEDLDSTSREEIVARMMGIAGLEGSS